MNRFLICSLSIFLATTTHAQEQQSESRKDLPGQIEDPEVSTTSLTKSASENATQVPSQEQLTKLKEKVVVLHKMVERSGFSQAQIAEFSALVLTAPTPWPTRPVAQRTSTPTLAKTALLEISRQQTMAEAELDQLIRSVREKISVLDENVVAGLLQLQDVQPIVAEEVFNSLEGVTDPQQVERLSFFNRPIPTVFPFTMEINPEFIRLRELHEQLAGLDGQLCVSKIHQRKLIGVLRYQKVSANREMAILASMAAKLSDNAAVSHLIAQRQQLGAFLAGVEEKLASTEKSLQETPTANISWTLQTFSETSSTLSLAE